MLRVQAVESISSKMSVQNLGFPLPVKIEEDQKLFIDLDTEGNSPEDIVIEWHLEIRRFFGSYSAASGEDKLVSIMREYIIAITERAIHFEDIVRLQEMVEHHMEHIYWFYRDSDICFSDMYLDYMEHIMTFYVNLTLRVLLVLKKKIKVTQKKVNDITQKVIKRLSFYLLKSEYHIFHVLIRQTTTLVDGMIKDLMNILNSNICKQMFRNLYMHFLVLTPVADMSDEAFCRAYILFENWKAFEDHKQNEKIDECLKNIFNRDVKSIGSNEFLSKILTAKTSIMSELMKVMGCDPSITKAYFDYIKSKRKVEGEIVTEIENLSLEDSLRAGKELTDEEEDEAEGDAEYTELFDQIMGDTEYNLNEVVLDCKNEREATVTGAVNVDPEILILDTDSDSDVEIVSIIPSQNNDKRTTTTTTTRRSRNPVANPQPPTSFLESISINVDTTSRKFGFRTLGNFSNSPQRKTTELIQTATETPVSINSDENDILEIIERPIETCFILDDDICEISEGNGNSVNQDKDQPATEKCNTDSPVNIIQADTSDEETSKMNSVKSTRIEEPTLSIESVYSDVPLTPMEIVTSKTSPEPPTTNEKIVEVSSSVERSREVTAFVESSALPVEDASLDLETSGSPMDVQTNETMDDACSSELSPALNEKDVVLGEVLPSLEEFSSNIEKAIEPANVPKDINAKGVSSETKMVSAGMIRSINSTEKMETGLQSQSVNVEEKDQNPLMENEETIQSSGTTNEKIVEVSSSVDRSKEISAPVESSALPVEDASPDSETSGIPMDVQTNETISDVCSSPLYPALNEKDVVLGEVLPNISCTTENVKVIVEKIPTLEEFSRNIEKIIEPVPSETKVVPAGMIGSISSTEEVETGLKRSVNVEEKDQNPLMEYEKTIQSSPERSVHNEEPKEVHSEEFSVEKDSNKIENVDVPPSISLENQMDALSILPEQLKTVVEAVNKPKNGFVTNSDKVKTVEINSSRTKQSNECQANDRTFKCGNISSDSNCEKKTNVSKLAEEPEVSVCAKFSNCRTESQECNKGCGEDETVLHAENNEKPDYANSMTESSEIIPLDTGQENVFFHPLDTGQFDPNSPPSSDEVDLHLKSSDKTEVKMLRVVNESLLRKEQQHGEFGYPTPPGSEEEREKDSDEQTQLIYSHIMPTKTFDVDTDPHDSETEHVSYKALTTTTLHSDDFLGEEVEIDGAEISTAETELMERLSDEEKDKERSTSPSINKAYEQIVKDAVGSQNSTEDEDDETPSMSKKCNVHSEEDDDISFDEMEQFLKNCDNQDFPLTNRKKRKRLKEKSVTEDNRSKIISFGRSPKRVKINEKPETHFIPKEQNEYESSSSDNDDDSPNKPKSKRRPSPMPLSKFLCKRNGSNAHIPLSGRLTPDKPPPLKGILKRIEQKHSYHPLHPVDDEPETVVIVLHQRDVGRGKRGSIEVKVYRKSFTTHKIPFDDHKLCHHAFVNLDEIKNGDVDVWGRVSDRTRVFEEELYCQPEKPMYKIVFDKQTPQLNSNDRKYYCDPSISSGSTKPKSTFYESNNEQGTVNLSTEFAFITTQDPVPEPAIPPPFSPPCFSPSSNSSSEFSDPTNLIPYQDIERALQVVEPEKSEENGYSLEARGSDNVCVDKSLVDRIALETIELLSDNADFHKMLKDLNGEILIENLPIIGIENTTGLSNVITVSQAPSRRDDLVSNLNSDEQLLKKVCQELESKALVDHLVQDLNGQLIIADPSIKDNCTEVTSMVATEERETNINGTQIPDQIIYQAEHNIQVSSFSSISFNVSKPNQNSNVLYSETDLNAPNVTSLYSAPIPNFICQQTYSSVPDIPFAHSNYQEPNYPRLISPTFPPKLSPLSPFQPDIYSVPHYPSNVPSYSASNSPHLSTKSPVSSPLHQQAYAPSVPSTIPVYPETNFSESSSVIPLATKSFGQETYSVPKPSNSSLNSSSIVPNSFSRETYSVPEPSLLHPSIGGSQLKRPIYPSSKSPQIVQPLVRDTSAYSENNRLIGTPQCPIPPYPQSKHIAQSSSYTNTETHSLVHSLSSIMQSYNEPTCLFPSVTHAQSSHFESKSIVPSPPQNVPPYSEPIGVNTYTNPLRYRDIVSSLSHKCIETNSLRSGRNYPDINSNECDLLSEKPKEKTDKCRGRLPKEVLTISQMNASKNDDASQDWIDNNDESTSSSICTVKSKNSVKSKRGSLRKLRSGKLFSMLLRDPRVVKPFYCASLAYRFLNKRRMYRCLRRNAKRKKRIIMKLAKKSLCRAALRDYLKKLRKAYLRRKPKPKKDVQEDKPPAINLTSRNNQPHDNVIVSQNEPIEDSNEQEKPKLPARKRGRPRKNAQVASEPAEKRAKVELKRTAKSDTSVAQNNIPSTSNNIPVSVPNSVHDPHKNERVPPVYQLDVPPNRNRRRTQPQQPREPSKKAKDHKSYHPEPPRSRLESSKKVKEPKKPRVESVNIIKESSSNRTDSQKLRIEHSKTVRERNSNCTDPQSRVEPSKIIKDHNSNGAEPLKNIQDSKTKRTDLKKSRVDSSKIKDSNSKRSESKQHRMESSKTIKNSNPNRTSSQQPRIEPLKIIKDPNSNVYSKVVTVSTKPVPLPTPIPEVYNFHPDPPKKVAPKIKAPENGESEVEFETHLPLKKRKLSMPVPSSPPTHPKTLANVPRARTRKDDISYPATPMLSIADVYIQPRTFKTPAEKKQLPPEPPNRIPLRFEPPPDPQFNCGLNAYNPGMYAFGKCPYSIELDCNSYCPPPVLFPPESFSHTN